MSRLPRAAGGSVAIDPLLRTSAVRGVRSGQTEERPDPLPAPESVATPPVGSDARASRRDGRLRHLRSPRRCASEQNSTDALRLSIMRAQMHWTYQARDG